MIVESRTPPAIDGLRRERLNDPRADLARQRIDGQQDRDGSDEEVDDVQARHGQHGRRDAHFQGLSALRSGMTETEVHGARKHRENQEAAYERRERDAPAPSLEPGQTGDEQRAAHALSLASGRRP